jgi:hypothetical protein
MFRVRAQLAEVFGPVNRWYCSQAHGRPVEDEEALLVYFVRSGGAKDFADRFDEAMSALNRWYCSERHRRDVREPEILWNYYMTYRLAGPGQNPTRATPFEDPSEGMSIAG